MGFIDDRNLSVAIEKLGKSDYAGYLRRVLKEDA
jgi:hypothetical protein